MFLELLKPLAGFLKYVLVGPQFSLPIIASLLHPWEYGTLLNRGFENLKILYNHVFCNRACPRANFLLEYN